MSSVKRCLLCAGQKTIMGMGMVPKTCGDCQGAGYLEEENKQEDKYAQLEEAAKLFRERGECVARIPPEEAPRKRGRPKKK